ncbi:MAG: phosphotransferase [Nitrospira sp.]|jgi:hypothetical protein|nr:phosphotransferase [Nitrospira sp.]
MNTSGEGCQSARDLSLLELLHPDGFASQALVLGSGCPSSLEPASPLGTGDVADLILAVPSASECRTPGWLRGAVQTISQKLHEQGIAYILVPPRLRAQVRKLLADQGLCSNQALMHLPGQETSRYILPLDPISIRSFFSKVLPVSRWGRLAITFGFQFFQGDQFFMRAWPAVGLVVCRPGARPLCEWLFRLDGQADRSGSVIIRRGWRGRNGAVILYRFMEGEQSPSAVGKVGMSQQLFRRLVREAECLDRLGPHARTAGARVPERLSLEPIQRCPVLLQTMIEGEPLSSLLAAQPHRLPGITDALVSWLERWNSATMVTRTVDRPFLDEALLNRAALLAPFFEYGEQYRNELMQRCAKVIGVPSPLVSTHNDLTMWNIMLSEPRSLGIIDWESARECALPFVDFFYAMTDAVAVARARGSRLEAFKECFAVDGACQSLLSQYLMRLRRVVQVPDEMVGLCFHACWLHHAANEQRSTGSSEPRPFLQLVQWLSQNKASLCRWVHA